MTMRMLRPIPLCLAVVAGGTLAGLVMWKRTRRPPTFARDIAPIVYAKCSPCHRPGEAGPFSLITFDDVARRARQVREVTSRRFMPPWKPTPGFVDFRGDRSLTQAQIDLIGRWVEAGAPLGDKGDTQPIPTWPQGWQLGHPDLVVQMPDGYTVPAEGPDIYRNFVIRSPVDRIHFVKAWEFRPGSRALHHAILNIDRLGLARHRDAEDGKPGFAGMDVGNVQSADGFYLVWAPGSTPPPPDPSRAWRLDEHTDLVLQLHMQPRGKEETVRPTIGLYFSDRPPTEQLFTLRIGDPPIDIPPGDSHYVVHSNYTLPADVDVLSLFPHAHYLAKTMRAWATLPDHAQRALLQIDDWDFNWQDAYTYARPISLPAGTTLSMEFVYDNSDDNLHNPNDPPRRVTTGERSTDEMGNITFTVLPHDARGLVRLRVSSYERLLGSADTARNQYNLANALADDGRTDDAAAHYRRAIEEDPCLTPALFNLGNLLLARGDADGAVSMLGKAVGCAPDDVSARINLGHSLEANGRLTEAIRQYRTAIASDGRSVLAHASLGVALAEAGDRPAAIVELRQALSIDPTDARVRRTLEALLSDAGG